MKPLSAFCISSAVPKRFATVGMQMMLDRLEQPLNARSPILITLSGITMLVRLEQLKNSSSPILVMLSGITMLVRVEQ